MQVKFTKSLGDLVVTKSGVQGVVTHLGFDGGGENYLIEWQKSDGAVQSRWYRGTELA